ncbi:MAG: TonB family protein [Myxococcota bacterium]
MSSALLESGRAPQTAPFDRASRAGREGRIAPWLLGALGLHLALALGLADRAVDAPGFAAPPALALVLTAPSTTALEAAPDVPEPLAQEPPPETAPPPPVETARVLPVSPSAPPRPRAEPLPPPPEPMETADVPEPSPPEPAVEPAPEPVSEPVAAVSAAPSSPAPSPADVGAVSAAIIARYQDRVRAQVERQKQYPAMARRRGIEDRIWVEFDVEEDGALGPLRIDPGGHRVLARATRAAVAAAAPFPPPPDGRATVRIPVDYALSR